MVVSANVVIFFMFLHPAYRLEAVESQMSAVLTCMSFQEQIGIAAADYHMAHLPDAGHLKSISKSFIYLQHRLGMRTGQFALQH